MERQFNICCVFVCVLFSTLEVKGQTCNPSASPILKSCSGNTITGASLFIENDILPSTPGSNCSCTATISGSSGSLKQLDVIPPQYVNSCKYKVQMTYNRQAITYDCTGGPYSARSFFNMNNGDTATIKLLPLQQSSTETFQTCFRIRTNSPNSQIELTCVNQQTQLPLTTIQPITQPPTTQAPTTPAPTTPAPTPPTTPAPTTPAPTTLAPTTPAPTTPAPTPPTTPAPTTPAPTTPAPTTPAGTAPSPSTVLPTVQSPATPESTAQPPTSMQPTSTMQLTGQTPNATESTMQSSTQPPVEPPTTLGKNMPTVNVLRIKGPVTKTDSSALIIALAVGIGLFLLLVIFIVILICRRKGNSSAESTEDLSLINAKSEEGYGNGMVEKDNTTFHTITDGTHTEHREVATERATTHTSADVGAPTNSTIADYSKTHNVDESHVQDMDDKVNNVYSEVKKNSPSDHTDLTNDTSDENIITNNPSLSNEYPVLENPEQSNIDEYKPDEGTDNLTGIQPDMVHDDMTDNLTLNNDNQPDMVTGDETDIPPPPPLADDAPHYVNTILNNDAPDGLPVESTGEEVLDNDTYTYDIPPPLNLDDIVIVSKS